METVTFKQVHQELEKEALFLKNNNFDFGDFGRKAHVLKSIGLGNSIAAKIYKAIADNKSTIEHYKKTNPLYTFILEPQLERVCEKYNLFVRPLTFFLGDIPEKNVDDILNFQVHLDDLEIEIHQRDELKFRLLKPEFANYPYARPMLDINSIFTSGLTHLFEIAAVKDLFNPAAFERSQARIISTDELKPKNIVELDPIILFKVRGGRLIITAWGDEANDELVANPKNN